MTDVTLAVVAGTTATAAIDGISAAGADPELRKHTPSADIEIVADGRPAPDSVVPVSPSGCPTPAVVTRAVRELVGFEFVGVDAGLAVPTAPTGAQVLDAGAAPGGDVRDPEPVPDAAAIFEAARGLVPEIVESRTNASDGDDVDADDDRELLVAETIPAHDDRARRPHRARRAPGRLFVAAGEPPWNQASGRRRGAGRQRDRRW